MFKVIFSYFSDILNRTFFAALFYCLILSCKKFIEIPAPAGQLVSQNLFASDATASSAIDGIYSRMISGNGFASGGISSVTVLSGLSADELDNFSVDPWTIEFYTNTLSINNSQVQGFLWAEPFQYIYTANASIEGISASKTISEPVRSQLLGEGKFIRAFCYFYLVNLFGDIPLLTASSYLPNSGAKRDSVTVIYEQMLTDLKDAESLLSDDYSSDGGERVRPNKSAAQALLARIYLYDKDWSNAEQFATMVISKTNDFALEQNLDSVFLAGSREAIWQLKPNQPGYNTNEANIFIFSDQPFTVALNKGLVSSFEIDDERKIHWIDSTESSGVTYYYPYKYKIPLQAGSSSVSEYSIILRLAEQYLIRAEARAQQNNLSGAQSDLNVIRNRAGLPDTGAMNQSDLLKAISQERRIELFTEWGHRWLDLKRTQTVDSVMSAVAVLKGGQWKTNQQLYPIPQTERQADPNLSQNPGY